MSSVICTAACAWVSEGQRPIAKTDSEDRLPDRECNGPLCTASTENSIYLYFQAIKRNLFSLSIIDCGVC